VWNTSFGGALVSSHPMDITMTKRFGATDHPSCPKCRHLMRLSRRMPHPVRGAKFELQTFTCTACRHEIERDADRLGEIAS